jgi:activator of 2-hydroxyglutaryl-CoA dehydratase
MNKIQKMALQCILFCMDEIKNNLQSTYKEEDIIANCEAMKTLAEAFEKVAGA